MAFLPPADLAAIGFARCGRNVLISDKASIYNAANIHIGSNVRIDDFAVLSAGDGGIHIGSYVHIGVFASLIGNGRIELADFCGLSGRVSIYSSSDDFSGEALTNPTVPEALAAVVHQDVLLGCHVIVGSGSVLLPGAVLETGVAVGALSLVNRRCREFGIYYGRPVRRIGERGRTLLDLEKRVPAGDDGAGEQA